MKIVLITRASEKDGLGHVGRCVALAKAFVTTGNEIEILVLKDPGYSLPHDINSLPILTFAELDEALLVNHLDSIQASIMVVDMRNPPSFLYHLANERHMLSISLSVVGVSNYEADLLINPLASVNPEFGSCQLINNKMAYIYDISRFLTYPRPDLSSDYVMITLGGSSGLYEVYKYLIDSIAGTENIEYVIFIKEASVHKKFISEYIYKPQIHFVNDMFSQYLCHARYVICGYGTTLWESLAMGKPCYVIPLRPQHYQHASKLKNDAFELANLDYDQGFPKVANWLRKMDSESENYNDISQKIKGYFNPELLLKLCNKIITIYNYRCSNASQKSI